jgi:hypothetical protein
VSRELKILETKVKSCSSTTLEILESSQEISKENSDFGLKGKL